MDKRLPLAIILVIGVIFITPYLFPSRRSPARQGITDTSSTPRSRSGASNALAVPTAAAPVHAAASEAAAARSAPVETTTVAMPHARYRFSSAGGALIGAELPAYRALPARDAPVALQRSGSPLLAYRVIVAGDTLDLSTVPMRTDTSRLVSGHELGYEGTAALASVRLHYQFVADSYLVRVSGSVRGHDTAAARLAVLLPRGLASAEADTLDDHRHLAFVVKSSNDGAESVPFAKLQKTPVIAKAGPFDWVASKNKYFLLAVLAPDSGHLAGPAVFTAPADSSKVPSVATGEVIVTPDAQGRFAFSLYAGPQEWRRLVAIGHDLEHANPYGGFMQGLVQPLATPIMRVLLWMHDTFHLNYGWVLVIFGVAVRLVLWPLNQSAMRSSLRMQRVQPEMQELQKRYKTDSAKFQEEYMKLLKRHGMTPFSQFSGCLPMLIPMPVLFALFFVFQNTIEFRGVSFLWLPDISLKDPYYILPLVMGATMFLLSWVGMRNAPPNPQAKTMGYMMPALFVFLFLNFPSGLNLYYAVQNLAALPQQWLLARERAKQTAT